MARWLLLASLAWVDCWRRVAAGGIDYANLPPGMGISEMVPVEPEEAPPPGLLEIPEASDEAEFVKDAMEPKHAVAVVVVGKGSKRHILIQEVAEDAEIGTLMAVGARFEKGKSSITVHHYGYGDVTYEGKWTRSAIKAWLLEQAYPLVNKVVKTFPSEKYLGKSQFGVVLISQPDGADNEGLLQALEPYAKKRPHLKFTFFTRSSDELSRVLAKACGIWTEDELVLMESPREQQLQKHSHKPRNPKYRLVGVSPERLQQFFEGYDKGSWPRYFVSAKPPLSGSEAVVDGVRILTSWDFVEEVRDAKKAWLVLFESKDCAACKTFGRAMQEIVQKLQDARRRAPEGPFRHLTIAKIDQSSNEHTETIGGTPLLRYWPRGSRKRTTEVDELRAEAVWSFLEDKAAEDFGSGLEGEL